MPRRYKNVYYLHNEVFGESRARTQAIENVLRDQGKEIDFLKKIFFIVVMVWGWDERSLV